MEPGAIVLLASTAILLLLWFYGRYSESIIDWLRSFATGSMVFSLVVLCLLSYLDRISFRVWAFPFLVVPLFFFGISIHALTLAAASQVYWLPDVVLRDGVFGLLLDDLNSQQRAWVLLQALGLATTALLELVTALWVIYYSCLANAFYRSGISRWMVLAGLTQRFGRRGALIAMFVSMLLALSCVSNELYGRLYLR